MSSDRIGDAIDRAFRLLRLFLILLAFDLYLTYVLGLFPWTRAVSYAMLGYVVSPARTVAQAFIGYLPNLLFVIFIALIIRGAIRLVKLFFHQIEEGKIVFKNFPAEWADPTYKIVRLLLVAFGLIVAFPYLPASDSAAFAGVSVFMGVLFSLSSSSAISNAIAGVVLTYTGAFRLGERVKLGETFGDIVEMSMLATRDPHDQERRHHDSQQPRPRRRHDQLLAAGELAGPDPPHQRHHRLRRALAEDSRAADRCRAGHARDSRDAARRSCGRRR